jgi:hypothetical protein
LNPEEDEMDIKLAKLASAVMTSLQATSHQAAVASRSARDPREIASALVLATNALDVTARLIEAIPEARGHDYDQRLTLVCRSLRETRLRVMARWLQSVDEVSEIDHAAARAVHSAAALACATCDALRSGDAREPVRRTAGA